MDFGLPRRIIYVVVVARALVAIVDTNFREGAVLAVLVAGGEAIPEHNQKQHRQADRRRQSVAGEEKKQ